MDFLNFGKKGGTHQFLEKLFHNNYTPQITVPTGITDRSATLIDNIFSVKALLGSYGLKN